MKQKNIKSILLIGAGIMAISGAFAWHEIVKPSLAATAEHGDGHGHEEGEESHDAKKEEHGHGHKKEEKGHDDHGEGEEAEEHEEGGLKLTPEQLSASGVKIFEVKKGSLSHEVSVPGRIISDADRIAQIVPKVSGVVIEASKNLGDTVKKGEVMALIESREMAEAVAEHQAASRAVELAKTTYNREKTLWEKKVTAEQDYLAAKNEWHEAQINVDLTKQKLETLGHTSGKGTPSRYHELKSPLDGVVIERELTLGEAVDTSHKAFTVADLSVLWVETAIAPDDLPFVKEGQEAIVQGADRKDTGKLIFVSPVIHPDTRSAKAIIELANPEGKWRSGDYATALIVTDTQEVGVVVPNEAIQTMEGKPHVFVKTPDGFEKREVSAGKSDSQHVEILSGLQFGENVAIGNTFTLKAEAGKSEAEHAH